MSATSNDDLLRLLMATFADQAKEQLQALNQKLLALEKAPDGEQRSRLLEEIFREAHSLKGASRAVDLDDVEAVAHRLETLFGKIQNGELEPSGALFDLAYRALDAIGALMESALAGEARVLDTEELLAALEAAAGGEPEPAPVDEPAGFAAPMSDDEVAAFLNGDSPDPDPAPMSDEDVAAFLNGECLPEEPAPPKVPAAAKAPAQAPRMGPGDGGPGGDETVRVATSKLDALMAQVGELLAARIEAEQRLAEVRALRDRVDEFESSWHRVRPQLRQLLTRTEEGTTRPVGAGGIPAGISRESALAAFIEEADERFGAVRQELADLRRRLEADSRRVAQVTTDLQDDVRRTRMMPISTVFDAFPRMVRDLARELDKKVALRIEGGATEVDRSVLEQLKAPLTHMIRNCVDHGLEAADARLAAGKDPEGTVVLRASQRGANLLIEVIDDGPGIDPERVRAKAVDKGLLSGEAAEALSEREALWLIFRAGFSTKAAVTDVSGRGVGMDVVREAVERLHGMIAVDSVLGGGSHFSISLPVSVATTRCLFVEAGGQSFALPIANVDRIIRLEATDVHVVGGHEAVHVDGKPTALARLGEVLTLPGGGGGSMADGRPQPAIVLGTPERRVAFLVDGLLGAQEVAMKGLPRPLVRVRHVAGATIVGTGDVVPVLNVADLLRSTGRVGAIAGTTAAGAAASSAPPAERTILVVDDSMTIRTLNKNILEAAGYRVKVAADGAEAWSMLQADAVCDLVVSDVEMPNMDGRELTEHVRSDDALRHLPVILVTSLDSAEDRRRGIAAGADAYIVKGGFDQDKLLETVGRLV